MDNTRVVIHPLVLLSVADHWNRVSKTQNVKRTVGILLGISRPDKTIDISNSFAVPFDEKDKVFFLDDDYLESMYAMFYKVAAREKIVGWYHTGPTLCKNDIKINEQLKKFTPNPVLVIIQAVAKDDGAPIQAYIEVEEVHDDGTPPKKTFEHLTSEIGAEEAEEVGVEHLLRDIKNQTAGTLSQQITDQLLGLREFVSQLSDIERYLREVARGEMPVNRSIINRIQNLLKLMPDVTMEEFVNAHTAQTNDQLLCIYLGSLIRSVIAHHELVDNQQSMKAGKEKAVEKEEGHAKDNAEAPKVDDGGTEGMEK